MTEPPVHEVLCVLLPADDPGVGALDRVIGSLHLALPGASVITAPISRELAALVDASGAELVVLHDPAFPFVTPEQILSVCAAVTGAGGATAAVAVADVTDTLELVGDDDLVVAGLDRTRYAVPIGPLAIGAAALAAALAAVDIAPRFDDVVTVLDRLVGVELVRLDLPGAAACRVVDADSLAYARALLGEPAGAPAVSASGSTVDSSRSATGTSSG